MTHDELVQKLDAMFRAESKAVHSKGKPYSEVVSAWTDFKEKKKEIQTYVTLKIINDARS